MMKRFLSVVLVAALFCTQAMAFTFEQVSIEDLFAPEVIEQEKVSDWAAEEVDQAMQAGLVTEHTSTYMTRSITRFQFAELIVNWVEKVGEKALTPAEAGTFNDCDETAVLKAYAAGIVDGVGNGRFNPNAYTNREQIATMIARAIRHVEAGSGVDLAPKAASLAGYADHAQVSSWAAEGVGLLAANGIMNGTSATMLSPKKSCTVEQSILLCYRLYVKFLQA